MTGLQHSVLFVDDEPLLARAVERELRGHFLCALSPRCADSLALLQHRAYDFLVTDFLLPDGNGVNLLREVAQRWPRCRRVLVSAHLDHTQFQGAQAAGLVHALLHKPWGRDELLHTLQGLDARRPRLDSRP